MFVFISYRRGSSRHVAGRLRDHIGWECGPDGVFLDTQSLRPGEPFPDGIRDAIRRATHVLVVIGPGWDGGPAHTAARPGSTGTPSACATRLQQETDFVRQEVAWALACGCEVIPVLVDGAEMPPAEQLPTVLRPLLRLQAYTIHNDQNYAEQIRPLLTHLLGREPQGGDTPSSLALKIAGGAAGGFVVFLIFSAITQFVFGLDANRLFAFADPESADALWQLLPVLFAATGGLAVPLLRRRWRSGFDR